MKPFTAFTISGENKAMVEFLNFNGIAIIAQLEAEDAPNFCFLKIDQLDGSLYAVYACEELPVAFNIPEQSFDVQSIIDRFREPDEADEVTKLKARVAQLESELKKCKQENVIELKTVRQVIDTMLKLNE